MSSPTPVTKPACDTAYGSLSLASKQHRSAEDPSPNDACAHDGIGHLALGLILPPCVVQLTFAIPSINVPLTPSCGPSLRSSSSICSTLLPLSSPPSNGALVDASLS